MTDTLLCFGPSSTNLREPLLALTGAAEARVTWRSFPDQETCLRIEDDVRGRDVVVVQGTHPPQDRHLQQLYQMLDIASANGSRRIVAVIPYLAYSRQDRRTTAGEAFSGMLPLRTAAMLGAEAVVTVDVHNPAMFERAPLPAVNLNADELTAEWLAARAPSDPILVSPDRGGSARVQRIAGFLGWPHVTCSKFKDERGTTWYEDDDGVAVRGRHAVIVDDLCSSGSTLAPLLDYLGRAGATDCSYGVTHFLADRERVYTLVGRPLEIFSTDTVPGPCAALSVAPLIASWLRVEGFVS
jgi:ribose-phosphate pyrophosphokinase